MRLSVHPAHRAGMYGVRAPIADDDPNYLAFTGYMLYWIWMEWKVQSWKRDGDILC